MQFFLIINIYGKWFKCTMNRKIHITREQFDRLMESCVKEGVDEILNGSYLADKDSDGNVKDLGYEVGLNPLPDGTPVTTNDIADELSPRNGYMDRGVMPARGGYTMESEVKKNLVNEVSAANMTRKHKVSGPLAQKMTANYNAAGEKKVGSKRIEHLLSGYTDNYASNLLSDINSGNITQKEYDMIGGDDLKNELDRRVKSDQTIDKSFKQSQAASGVQNAFISPHTKTGGNGMAHTKKTSTDNYYGA